MTHYEVLREETYINLTRLANRSIGCWLTGIIQLARSPYFDTCIAPRIVMSTWPLQKKKGLDEFDCTQSMGMRPTSRNRPFLNPKLRVSRNLKKKINVHCKYNNFYSGHQLELENPIPTCLLWGKNMPHSFKSMDILISEVAYFYLTLWSWRRIHR